MKILEKLIAGNKVRKTRFHDEKGNFVSLKNTILHGPAALITGLFRLLLDYRPQKPWISYSSIRFLQMNLTKQSRVLEFGSGMSTIWYSKFAGKVYSVDDYKPWYDKVAELLKKHQASNVQYFFAPDAKAYSEYMMGDEKGFDLIMVDGSVRSKCVANSLALLREGGIFYLDNSDKDSSGLGGDMREAERLLADFAKSRNLKLQQITDFAPTQLFVQQGSYIQLPASGSAN